MGRTQGRRNANFEEKRKMYAQRALQAWLDGGMGSSMREIARACETSVSNLRHYFGDRDGLFEAIVKVAHLQGKPFMDRAAQPPPGVDARTALLSFMKQLLMAWRQFGVGRIVELSVGEGMGGSLRGMACVNFVLEPMLDSGERLIAALIERGDLPEMNVRAAALTLLSPIILGLLHQDTLDGSKCRPLDLDAMIDSHMETWLHGHALPRQTAQA